MTQGDSSLLSPVDVAWLRMGNADNPMVITSLVKVEGLTAERLQVFLDNYWVRWERFRCRPVLRNAAWRWDPDEHFSLKHHLRVWALPLNGQKGLEGWVTERLADPLPQTHPHWCFHFRQMSDGVSVVLLRIHHCYADGLSLLSVFDHLCTAAPDESPHVPDTDGHFLRQQWLESSRDWLLQQLPAGTDGPAALAAVASVAAQGEHWSRLGLRLVNELTQYFLEPPDSDSSLRPGLSGHKVCGLSAPRPLEDFARAARQTGARINDVLLTCVAEAMHHHLRRCGENPQNMLIHAAVPVDLRPHLPESLRPPRGSLGNLFGTVFVPLPVDADHALERLYRIKHETRRLKQSWQPGISLGLLATAGLLPRDWQAPLTDLFSRKASAVVSNVPGAREVRYLAGCKVLEQMFWVPQSGQIGLGVSILSYAGQVQFGVLADKAVLPDPTRFLQDCLDTLDYWAEKS